jgi:hypothetical protein
VTGGVRRPLTLERSWILTQSCMSSPDGAVWSATPLDHQLLAASSDGKSRRRRRQQVLRLRLGTAGLAGCRQTAASR